jgi:hypothetical protein
MGPVGRIWDDSSQIPEQLHVNTFSQDGFSLGPGQTAMIPYSFYPRYPSVGVDMTNGGENGRDRNNDGSRHMHKNPRRMHIDGIDPHSAKDGQSPLPTLSRSEHLDLVNLLGWDITNVLFDSGPLIRPSRWFRPSSSDSHRRRNNLDLDSVLDGHGDLYEISATVVVRTSRGTVKFPIGATSVRENPYGIPDVIKFRHPSFSGTNVDRKGGIDEIDDSESPPPSLLPSSSPEKNSWMDDLKFLGGFAIQDKLQASDSGRFLRYPIKSWPVAGRNNLQKRNGASSVNECFDMYISNPRVDQELQIVEVLISKPKLMNIRFDPGRLFFDDSTDSTISATATPSDSIREWTQDGPLSLPPGAKNAYVLTLCTGTSSTVDKPDSIGMGWPNVASDPDRDLGVMHIRTDKEVFYVFLEHSDKKPDMEIVEEITSPAPESLASAEKSKGSLLQTVPERLDFTMISTSSPAVHSKFGLRNRSPEPVRIMRAVVLMNTQEGRDIQSTELGLEVNIGLAEDDTTETNGGDDSLGHLVVEPFSSADDMFIVSCSLDPSSTLLDEESTEDFEFNGTILVRGTLETDMPYEKWREDMRLNPYRDDHVIAEVAFSILILNPRVEAMIDRSTHPYPQLFASQGWDNSELAVSFLFFPMTAFDAAEGTEESLPTQTYVRSNKIMHDLRIFSNIAHVIELEGGKIVDSEPDSKDSLCARFNVTKSSPLAGMPHQGLEELGHLSLVYNFDIFKRSETQQIFVYPKTGDDLTVPKTCYLNILTTYQGSEPFQIPLIIFPGHLELSTGEEAADGPAPSMKMGFDHLLSWAKNSGSGLGKSLIEILPRIVGGRGKDKSDLNLLALYIRRLTHHKSRKIKSRFRPIMLNMGTIDNGKVARAPLYFTNLNPVPVQLSIDVGEVEGMSISLSRVEGQSLGDGNSLLDGLPTYTTNDVIEEGNFEGHPIAGLLEFLSSNEKALAFTSSFNYRDAVDYDSDAINRFPFLRFLYEWYSSATFHRSQSPIKSQAKSSTECGDDHPPPYASNVPDDAYFLIDKLRSFLFSSDGKYARPLKECTQPDFSTNATGGTIKIPPGSKARLEIQIRGPPQDLLESDISQLLATGLVLSTNFGDVMPIFVEFEALQGQLYGSLLDNSGNESDVLDVPLRCSWGFNQTNGRIVTTSGLQERRTKQERSLRVPLLLRSSFTSAIRLQKIESCNPWFKFVKEGVVENDEATAETNDRVGFIETAVDCSDGTGGNESKFPSYYQCALNWLTNRAKLQPDGCGLKTSQDSVFKHTHLEKVKRSVERANRALKREYNENNDVQNLPVWSELPSPRAIKTGRKRGDGVVTNLDLFSVAVNNLRVASEHGVNTLSSSFRATIEYTSVDSMHRQNLSLAVHNVVARAALEPPKLFDSKGASLSILHFSPTAVGSVSMAYLPIRNPTGVAVRVRLAVLARNANHSAGKAFLPPFVQNKNGTDHPEWWSGNGGFYTHDSRGDLVRSHHNITIKAGPGALVTLVNPSLHVQNVLLMGGCGVRCGLRGDDNQLKDKGQSGTTAPIGASAAAGVTLSGVTWHGPTDENVDTDDPILLSGGTSTPYSGGPSAFAVPYSALDEIVIPPFGTARLGPILFRPPGRYRSLGCDVVRESGARYSNAVKKDLCSDSNFDSVVYLENSLTGLESVVLTGKSRWARLIFLDPAEAGNDAYGDIEILDGKETFVFSGVGSNGDRASRGPLPVSKEVLLHNEGDEEAHIARVFLSGAKSGNSNDNISCSFGSFRLGSCPKKPFRLQPGESHRIVIEHIPNCKPQRESALLTVEIADDQELPSHPTSPLSGSKLGSRARSFDVKGPFEGRTYSLSVGYHMDDALFSGCVPVSRGRGRDLSMSTNDTPASSNETKSALRHRFFFGSSESEERSSLLVELFLLLAAASLLCFNTRIRSSTMRGTLPKAHGSFASIENKVVATGKNGSKKVRNHWNAAFRCFARVDPGSSELQALSREQMRQVVIGHYKAKGTAPPAALANANVFSRDRRAASGGPSRQRSGREAAGNERIRTLSDALFQNAAVSESSTLGDHLPVGLGWRIAVSRGVVHEMSSAAIGSILTSKVLMQDRLSTHQVADGDDHELNTPQKNDDDTENAKDTDGECSKEPIEDVSDPPPITLGDKTTNSLMVDSQSPIKDQGSHTIDVDSTLEIWKPKPVENDNKNTKNRDGNTKRAVSTDRNQTAATKNRASKESSEGKNEYENNKNHPTKTGNNNVVDENVTTNNPRETNKKRNETTEVIAMVSVPSAGKLGTYAVTGKERKEADAASNISTPPKKKKDQQIPALGNQQAEKSTSSKRGKGEQGAFTSTPASMKSKEITGYDKKSKLTSKGKVDKNSSARQKKKQTKEKEQEKRPTEKSNYDESNGPVSSPSPLRPPPGLAPPPGFGSTPSPLARVSERETSTPTLVTTPRNSTKKKDQPTLETMLNSALPNPDVDLNAAAASFQPQSIATTTPGTPSLALPTSYAGSADAASGGTAAIGGSGLLLGLSETSKVTTDSGNRDTDNTVGGLFSSVLPGLTSTTAGGTAGSSLPDFLDPETKNNTENGFDVMDFLDSILNEGSLRSEDDDAVDAVQSSPMLTAVATSITASSTASGLMSPSGGGLAGNTNPGAKLSAPVFENPWASDAMSRATAYGIAFDDREQKEHGMATRRNIDNGNIGDDDGVIPSSPIFGALSDTTTTGSYYATATATGTTHSDNINRMGGGVGLAALPLLTPAALLRAVDHDDDDEDQDEPNLLSSFYAFGGQQEEQDDDGDD